MLCNGHRVDITWTLCGHYVDMLILLWLLMHCYAIRFLIYSAQKNVLCISHLVHRRYLFGNESPPECVPDITVLAYSRRNISELAFNRWMNPALSPCL